MILQVYVLIAELSLLFGPAGIIVGDAGTFAVVVVVVKHFPFLIPMGPARKNEYVAIAIEMLTLL